MEILISKSDKFQTLSDELSEGLLKQIKKGSFVDTHSSKRLTNILENNDNGEILSLSSDGGFSSIIVVKIDNEYKLFWWKEMVRVANYLK